MGGGSRRKYVELQGLSSPELLMQMVVQCVGKKINKIVLRL